MNLIYKFWSCLTPGIKKRFFLVMILMFFGSLAEAISLGAALPFLSAAVDPDGFYKKVQSYELPIEVPFDDSMSLLYFLCIVFGGLALVSGIIRLLVLYGINNLTYKAGTYISSKSFSNSINQPYEEIILENSSNLLSGLMTKVSIVITGVINSALILFNSFFLIMIIVITMAVISVETTLLLFCFFAVVYYLIAHLVKKRLKINSGRIAQSQTSVAKIIQESRGAARDIILDNLQSYTLMQYVKQDKNWRRAAVSNIFIAGTPRYLFETLALLAIVGVVLFSLEREIDLLSIIPLLGTIVIVAQRLLPVAQQAYNAWVQMRGSHGALSDVVDILSKENNQEVTKYSNTGLKFTKDIELKNIEFSYDSGIRILNGINVNILKGEVIGIVGITGSGKSTLVDLIMGLIKPTKGDVVIDGVPLSGYKYSGWYNMISHVPQEIFLSDATIKENIAYGKNTSDIDIERVKDTLKLVQLYEFIESLPDQLNTIIGERGVRLSGGQKQRLGIARALYKDANLLVIDEGTSALDVETEKRVLQNIHNTCEELTVIMIAHRLETLKNCDRILLVDHGKVEKIISGPDIKSFCEANLDSHV